MDKKYFFLFPKISEKKTGLVFALLKRVKILSKQLGITPILITTDYDHSLAKNYWSLISNNLINPNIEYINLYGEIQGTLLEKTLQKKHHKENKMFNNQIDFQTFPTSFNKKYQDSDNNKYFYEIWENDNSSIKYINTFQNNIKSGRLIYDSLGYLSCIQTINPINQIVSSETYYHVNGYPVLIKNYELDENNNKILSNIFKLNKDGLIVEVFSTEQQLIQYWFSKYTDKFKKSILYITIDRAIHFYEPIRKIKKENMRIIGTIHATHLNGPDILKSSINLHYRNYFEFSEELDALVILTEKQKNHIQERFGLEKKLFVIPHIYEENIIKNLYADRDPFFCLTIARYDKAKNLDSLIRVFRKVVCEVPKAYLHIYGFGSEQSFLQEEIDKYNLNKNIQLMGYEEDTKSLYNKASLFLFSSRSEGFGMALLEAICHGCPSISYDIDYGPSEMIKHDENGYLIPFNDENYFAQKIISLLNDRIKREYFSQSAYNCKQLYDHELFAKKWFELFEKII